MTDHRLGFDSGALLRIAKHDELKPVLLLELTKLTGPDHSSTTTTAWLSGVIFPFSKG